MANPKPNNKETKEAAMDRRLLATLNALLKDAKKEVEEDRNQQEKDHKLYLGEQEIKKRGRGRADTKTNLLFSQIETMKPILTSNVPTAELRPVVESESGDEVSEEMSNVVNRILRKNDGRSRYTELVSNGLSFGMAWFKVQWNPELFSGFGDIEIIVPDTRSIYIEPRKDDIRHSNYIFECTRVNRLTLLRRYPDKRDEIDELFKKQGKTTTIGRMKEKLSSMLGYQATSPGTTASTTSVKYYDVEEEGSRIDQEVELVEAWFHDDEMIEEEMAILGKNGEYEFDPITQKHKTEKRLKPKYPSGRVVLFSENVIFDDRVNKFPGIPYIPYYNYRIPGQPYGMSELKQLAPIQKQYNSRANQLHDILNFSIGPIRYYDDRSGLDPDIVTNAPNQFVHVHDVNAVRTESPPSVGAAPFESLRLEKQNMETVSGVREITQGTVPGDIRSGAAIEALQEAADIRLRGKSGEIESTTYHLVRFIIEMVVQFYDYPTHFAVDEEVKGTPEFALWLDRKLTPDFFDIEIRAGVNLPRSRIAQQQFMQWMYDRQVVDERYLVNQSKLENKERLMERMSPLWDAKREAMMQQITGGGQPQQGLGQEQQVS